MRACCWACSLSIADRAADGLVSVSIIQSDDLKNMLRLFYHSLRYGEGAIPPQ